MNGKEKTESLIKLFAMANQLIVHSLERIENRFDIDLGHNQTITSDRDEKYYPQFDEDIRREAAGMSQHYEIFYCLEKSIRCFVSDMMNEAHGGNWWDSGGIPQNIHQDVAARIRAEQDSGTTRRSDQPLDYTSFGELSEIIKSNWDVFGSVFSSRKAVERVMGNLNTIRAPIAHCSPLAKDEIIRLQLSVHDWFRLME